jgi:putative ABC transport system substrate-binding protein
VTGVSSQNADLQGKRLQILKEVLPTATRVAVVHNPLNAAELPIVAALREASKKLGVALRVIELKSDRDFDAAFRMLDSERSDALYVVESSFTFLHRARIVEFASSRRLPDVYGLADFADAGGLMSYSFNLIEQFRAAATYVDKILKGAKPADLPVEQPMRFELVLNLRTAKALGIAFSPTILLRADRVIE